MQLDNKIQYNTIQYNTTQYNTTQHNTTQYNSLYNMLSWEFKPAWSENCSKNRKIRAKVDSRIYGRWSPQVMGSWRDLSVVRWGSRGQLLLMPKAEVNYWSARHWQLSLIIVLSFNHQVCVHILIISWQLREAICYFFSRTWFNNAWAEYYLQQNTLRRYYAWADHYL